MSTTPAIPVRPVAIKIDAETKERVKRLADARQRSPHWLMREAIRQYVEREEKREAFRQNALQAWQDFQARGLHVSQKEADAWLARLEAGKDAEPPECHA
ncbi:MAG: ribbon-helix-helix protein, CopG family [Burkholderiales bacterium]|nr:ribbon-helix-helix protein, CopG family [Burkholderiales bacterium]